MMRPTARRLPKTCKFSCTVSGSSEDGSTHVRSKGNQHPDIAIRGASAGPTGVRTVGAMGGFIFGEHSFGVGHDGDYNGRGVQRTRQSLGEQRGDVRVDGTQFQLKCG